MKDRYPQLVNRRGLLLDIGLTVIWFVFFTYMLTPFVPASSLAVVYLVSAITASCLAGVFFLSIQMLRLVYADQGSPREDN